MEGGELIGRYSFIKVNQYAVFTGEDSKAYLTDREGKRIKLLSFCHIGTRLMLAGILDSEYGTVKNAFESSGRCRELFSAQEKEWRGGAFEIIG